MLKQCLLVLVTAGLISIAAPFAAAQGSPSNDQQAPPSQDNGMRRHGPPDPAERTAELTRKLKLTSDQQAKVQDALQAERSRMESVHHDASLSQPDRHAKMMDIRNSTNAQIRSLLDTNQQKRWDEIEARREQRMQDRRQGPPDAGSGQPPQ